jgi:23S rRNA pseudouridine2605 synthase
MAEERLQKILARAGVASRRRAEALISAGRVTVGGRVVTELGTRADAHKDRIELDGRRLVAEPLVYLVFHKPRNVMCTMRDPEGRPTVWDYVKRVGVRAVPVGRLDFATSGVLLLSNDGAFASGLAHPRSEVPKIYVAKVAGVLGDAELERWRKSIVIDGRATRPAAVRLLRHEGDKTWLEVTLQEGRNRQVRRLGETTGARVLRLARVAYAGVTAEGLRPGEWRHLTTDELVRLKRAYGVPRRARASGSATRAGTRQVRSKKPPART